MQTSVRLNRLAALTGLALVPAIVIALVTAATRTALDDQAPSLAVELATGMTWSVLVCLGVAAGSALTRVSPATASAFAFVGTPLALAASKAVQGGLNQLIDQPSSLPPGIAIIAAVKAVEYGALAFVLARLARSEVVALKPHLLTGAAAAIIFGSLLIAVTAKTAGLTGPDLAPTAINELLFPLGCVMAVFLTERAFPDVTGRTL